MRKLFHRYSRILRGGAGTAFAGQTEYQATTPPTVPANFRIVSNTDTVLNLAWDAAGTIEAGGIVQYEIALVIGATYIPLYYVISPTLTKQVTGLVPSSSFNYAIRSRDSSNPSEWSDALSITMEASTDSDPPTISAFVFATPAAGSDQVQLAQFSGSDAAGNVVGWLVRAVARGDPEDAPADENDPEWVLSNPAGSYYSLVSSDDTDFYGYMLDDSNNIGAYGSNPVQVDYVDPVVSGVAGFIAKDWEVPGTGFIAANQGVNQPSVVLVPPTVESIDVLSSSTIRVNLSAPANTFGFSIYTVYVSPADEAHYTSAGTVALSANPLSLLVSGLDADTIYYAKATSTSGATESDASASLSATTPAVATVTVVAPNNVTAVSAGAYSANVYYYLPQTLAETAFWQIYAQKSGQAPVAIGAPFAVTQSTPYPGQSVKNVTGLEPSAQYTFKIYGISSVVNGSVYSASSNISNSITTDVAPTTGSYLISAPFNAGPEGALAQDATDAFTFARPAWAYSSEQHNGGAFSAKASYPAGISNSGGGTQFIPGFITLPSPVVLTEGKEIWVKADFWLPNDFDCSHAPGEGLKTIGISYKSAAGENRGKYWFFFVGGPGYLTAVDYSFQEVTDLMNSPVTWANLESPWNWYQRLWPTQWGAQGSPGWRQNWFSVEMYVKHSTVPGQGRVMGWINTELVVDKSEGFITNAFNTDYITGIEFTSYWNGVDHPTYNTYLYVDNIKVTTQRPSNQDSYDNYIIGPGA